jgi:hypothetical protein
MRGDRANDPVRKQPLKFVAIVVALIAFGFLMTRRGREPEPPSIHISVNTYIPGTGASWGKPDIVADYRVKNPGSPAFSFTPWMADFVRFETSAGWATNDLRLDKYASSVHPMPDYYLFPHGAVARGRATIPATAQRWQVGYEVDVASERKKLELKLGPK